MAGLPEITIAGTVVADPEIRYTASGAAVANFTVAANDRRFDRDRNEWVDAGATFLRCSIWRQAAENVAETLTKGTRVLVTGVLRQRSYEKDGQTRYAFEVDATEVAVSLKFATAEVKKATRTAGAPAALAGEPDPWGSAPPATATARTTSGFDEPPF
ncbi:single-stranded DNA-binding protein [Saccharopolyspora sp. NPDC000359]|uniref:single-stranded DNA-binding protein n=1 Tax=Saccharopolyspora sp. NPDC000359 TaxID=3154251 RepID=UPI003326157A